MLDGPKGPAAGSASPQEPTTGATSDAVPLHAIRVRVAPRFDLNYGAGQVARGSDCGAE